MRYWVISPNVNNDSTLDAWIKACRSNHKAYMGYDSDHDIGRRFESKVKIGDLIIIAQGANDNKRLFLAGIVSSEAVRIHDDNTPGIATNRQLTNCLSKKELEQLHLDFNLKCTFGASSQHIALYELKSHNQYDKRIIDKILNRISIKTRIKELIENPNEGLKSILVSGEFYFSKATDELRKWLSWEVSPEEKDQIISLGKDYNQFINATDSKIIEVRNQLNKIIAYCDYQAKDKNVLNEYQDKRILARSNVRQNAWINALITYKFDKDSLERKSVYNAITYLLKPEDNCTILSENHRELIGKNVLGNGYAKNSFTEFLKNFFSSFDINISNELNYTFFLSCIMYEIKEMWQKEVDPAINTKQETMKIKPLNQILFGPPGTGKTYNSIKEAIKIINPDFDLDQEWEVIKTEYDRLVDNNQIVFTTFHQSMSYEDFVEGIKPQEPEEKGQQVTYAVENGVFKQICKRANPILGNFETIIEEFKKEISESDDKSPVTIKGKGTTFDVIYRGTLVFYVQPHASAKEKPWYPVNIANIEKAFTTGNYEGVYNPTYVREIIAFLEKNKGLRKGETEQKSEQPYVLIIDEINRGNVSAIFGELITLIEENKRLGKDEALKVTLPYSKKEFGVPQNLHIIGTMNTADRSVEALDTALRRRFCFTEMPPKAELIKEHGKLKEDNGKISIGGYEVDLEKLLNTINDRINILLDKDHLIGHSFFMKVCGEKKLQESFSKEIIPLLQEYFYGDYGKIALVLGEGFCQGTKVDSNNNNPVFAQVNSDNEYEGYLEKTIYTIHDPQKMGTESFKSALMKLMNDFDYNAN